MSRAVCWAEAVLSLAAALLALSFAAWLLGGCGTVNATCQAVDSVHHACTVIRYLGPDGGVEEVHVTAEELAAFGDRTRVARANLQTTGTLHDAGTP